MTGKAAGNVDPDTLELAPGTKHENLEGWAPVLGSDAEVLDALEKAFDYRGDVTITCKDGRKLHAFVEHAIGSIQRPMSDADLRRKFHGLADPVLGNARGEQVIDRCVALSDDADVRALTASARASAEAVAAE